MKIVAVDLFTYHLPLVRPLPGQREDTPFRSGYLIRLDSETGARGWGESAPLPGFSRETLDDALRQLKLLRHRLTGSALTEDFANLSGEFDRWLGKFDLCPSVRFSVETATLSLLASQQEKPVAYLLARQPSQELHLNGLITDDMPVLESAERYQRDSYRAVKMKLGRQSIDRDTARTLELRRAIGDDASIRLDANRAWSFEDAVTFATAIRDCHLEYIEEPLADTTRLRELTECTHLPIALDESLLEMTPSQLGEHDYVSAVLLKPTLLGGLERVAGLARIGRQMGVKVVVSSCFESSVGVAALAQFAAAYGTPVTAVGLDTLGWFKRDVLSEPLDCSHGRLNLSQVTRASFGVNERLLDRCDDD